MADILDFINTHSLPDVDLSAGEGVWHKLESDTFKGSYIYNVATYKDKAVTILTVYNFKSGEKLSERFGADNLTKAELSNVQKKIDEQNEKAILEQKRKQNECASYAQDAFSKLSIEESNLLRLEHQYIIRKGLKRSEFPTSYLGNCMARRSILGATDLIIPFYDIDGKLWNYQSIAEDGSKQVLLGGRLQGCFFPLFAATDNFSDVNSGVVYLCEGFATAVSVYLALDQKQTVLACISATNLEYVVREITNKFPKLSYIICADNDCWKPDSGNAGLDAAQRIVSRIDGGSYGIPDFSKCDQTGKPTDFNDLLCLSSLLEVKTQIDKIKRNRPTIIYPLGYSQKTYYFITSKSAQVLPLSEFSESDLLKLAGLNYWMNRFPTIKGNIDFSRVKDFLIRECQKVGFFEAGDTRGRGEYIDSGDFTYHTGLSLKVVAHCDQLDLTDAETDFYYDPRK